MTRTTERSMQPKEQGAAAVEFALVLIPFLLLLFGVIEMGRWFFAWNSVVEASRAGARTAVVCDRVNDPPPTNSSVLNAMQRIVPALSDSNVGITYYALDANKQFVPSNNCGTSTTPCAGVKVWVTNYSIPSVFGQGGGPFKVLYDITSLPIPDSATSLITESMQSMNNPVCL